MSYSHDICSRLEKQILHKPRLEGIRRIHFLPQTVGFPLQFTKYEDQKQLETAATFSMGREVLNGDSSSTNIRLTTTIVVLSLAPPNFIRYSGRPQ